MVEPGTGFRLLKLGEQIKRSDEYLDQSVGWQSFDQMCWVNGAQYDMVTLHDVVGSSHQPIRRGESNR